MRKSSSVYANHNLRCYLTKSTKINLFWCKLHLFHLCLGCKICLGLLFCTCCMQRVKTACYVLHYKIKRPMTYGSYADLLYKKLNLLNVIRNTILWDTFPNNFDHLYTHWRLKSTLVQHKVQVKVYKPLTASFKQEGKKIFKTSCPQKYGTPLILS